MRFLWVYIGNQISQNFDPIARRLMNLKPNEIFNDFAISWEPINEIDPEFFYFKDMDYKLTLNSIGPDHMKCSEVGAE